jgi:hypothetical protein
VLGYGISLIILNGMVYVGIPVLAVMRFRKWLIVFCVINPRGFHWKWLLKRLKNM